MITPNIAAAAAPASQTAVSGTAAAPEVSFTDVLSALNPLHYLPGVGTIYRAITGDRPPEAMRAIGAVIVGGLLGGPVGAAISAVTSFLMHVSGIDLDDVAHDFLTSVGLLDDAKPKMGDGGAAPGAPATAERAGPSNSTRVDPGPAPQTVSATAADAPIHAYRDDLPMADPEPMVRRTALAAYGRTLGHA